MTGNLKDADNVVKTFVHISGAFFLGARGRGLGGGRRGTTAGFAHYQFCGQDEAPGFGTAPAVEAVEEHLGGAAAQFGGWLVHEGEAGAKDGGEFEVVEADEGDVLGDAQSQVFDGPEGTQGGQDVGGEQGRGAVGRVQEALRRRLALLDAVGAEAVKGFQVRGFECLFIALQAFAGGVVMSDVSDEGDAFVAVPDEVLRCLARAGAILDQHRVGLDPLGRTVKRDYRKPGPLLRL